MGFMFRVRLSSFFAGAAASSVGGFYYLYKDYMLAQQAISQQPLRVQTAEGAEVTLMDRFSMELDYILAVVDGSRETLYNRILDSHPSWDVEDFDSYVSAAYAVNVVASREHIRCYTLCNIGRHLHPTYLVRENYESLEGRYEALSARITALENPKTVETATPVEGI